MKKIINKTKYLLFACLIMLGSVASVCADTTFPNSFTAISEGTAGGTSAFPVNYGDEQRYTNLRKITDTSLNGTYVYCLEYSKHTPADTGTSYSGSKLVSKILDNETSSKYNGIRYILDHEYNKSDITADNFAGYYVTQMAIWWYIDRVDGIADTAEYADNSHLDATFKTNTSNKYVAAAKKLVTDAIAWQASGEDASKIVLTANNGNTYLSPNNTINRQLFYSQLVTVTGKNLTTDTYRLTWSEAMPTGTLILDENGNDITNTASTSLPSKFRVAVPTSALQVGATTWKFTVNGTGTTGKVYAAIPSDNSYQKILFAKTFATTVNAVNDINLTARNYAVNITKVKSGTTTAISGAELKLYDSTGVLVDSWTSNESAHQIVALDPNETYTIKEEKAPAGFNVSQQKTFRLDTSNSNIYVTNINYDNKVTQTKITKHDVTTGEELSGAHLVVRDENNNIVDDWISESDNPHYIEKLTAGKYYTLEETIAPAGYAVANTIKFKVKEDGSVTEVIMNDELTTTRIIKRDKDSHEALSGAHLVLKDKDGKKIEEWDTDKEQPHYVYGLTAGESYTVEEAAAPKGYKVSSAIKFTINSDGTVTEVFFDNELDNPVTGMYSLCGLIGLIALSVAGYVIIKKKYNKFPLTTKR